MKIIVKDIKSTMPSVAEAGKNLAKIIRENIGKNTIIKIIHGYGSTVESGKIKSATHRKLRNKRKDKEISAFIPGEAINRSGPEFVDDVYKYKHLIKSDNDFKSDNYGITYVFFLNEDFQLN